MPTMNPSRPRHRQTRNLRGWVLACLLLAWGLAWAAPLLKPPTLNLVCSAAGGVQLIELADDGQPAGNTGHQALDCALCLPSSLPPPAPPSMPVLEAGNPDGLPHFDALLVPTARATPPPARGPPPYL